MLPTVVLQIAVLILPLVPLALFVWVLHGYRNGTIRPGLSRRLPQALIVIFGVALPVWAHWNQDWYSTYSDDGRHLYLLSVMAIALTLGLSLLLQPIWDSKRRPLLLTHAVGAAAFALVFLGVMDPARLSQFPAAFFTFFILVLLTVGEAMMIWQIATARGQADDSTPYGIEPELKA